MSKSFQYFQPHHELAENLYGLTAIRSYLGRSQIVNCCPHMLGLQGQLPRTITASSALRMLESVRDETHDPPMRDLASSR